LREVRKNLHSLGSDRYNSIESGLKRGFGFMQAGIYSCRKGVLFACLISGSMLCAQQPTRIHNENGVYTLHEDTHLVLLDVTVTDKRGRPVDGLTKDDFKLQEDGLPQTINFFEEHAPVDPADIAREKAEATAGQPQNTFTNYEPFSGRPVTALLLNQLFPLLVADVDSLHQEMLDLVRQSPPDTPFAVYLLDSELRLVQPVTTDRVLLLAKIDEMEMWKNTVWKDPLIGWKTPINPDTKTSMFVDGETAARRRIMMTAMQQLAAGLKDMPGRKDLFAFTGLFQCSVVAASTIPPCPAYTAFGNGKEFLCGLMDTLEQGRIWIYRYYANAEIAYGFGCSSTGADVRDVFAGSHYYTLYYTPTSKDWSGKYRATTVEVAEKGLHLAYRKGYYGTPENAGAHYYTANGPAVEPVLAESDGSTITATADIVGTSGAEVSGTGAVGTAPNPASSVFSVQVVPASATGTDSKKKQEYRELTLRFTMPAREFKVVRSDAGQYAARMEVGAVGYADGRQASSNGSQVIQVTANFNGPADPLIAKSTIAATLTLYIPEHGRSRWLYVGVRDQSTGQSGNMVIPMGQVKMPGAQ
jgi:VWFA-related protein